MHYSLIGRPAVKLLCVALCLLSFGSAHAVLTATLTRPTDGGTIGGRAKVVFSANGGDQATVSWSVVADRGTADEKTITSGSGNVTDQTFFWDTTVGVSNAPHTLVVVAKDKDTAQSLSSQVTVTVDNTNFIKLTKPDDNTVTKGTVLVTGKAGGTWRLQLDNDSANPIIDNQPAGDINFNWDTSGATEGLHRLQLVVLDGNNNESQSSRNVTIDRTAPTISITAPKDEGAGIYLKGTSVTISADVTESNPDKWNVTVDGGTTGLSGTPPGQGTGNSVSITWNTTTYNQASAHTITVTATDKAGNVGSTTLANVFVDNIAPTVTLDKPNDNDVFSGPVDIQGTATDANLKQWTVTVNGSQTNVTNLSDNTQSVVNARWTPADSDDDGTYTVTLTAEDKAGNTKSISRSILLAKKPPKITFTNPNENDNLPTLRGNVTITATIETTGDATYIVSVKPTGTTSGTQIGTGTTKSVSVTWFSAQKNSDGSPKFPDGNYTIEISATDTKSSLTTVKTKDVKLDNTAPLVELTSPADKSFVKGVVTITGTVDDPEATWKVTADSQDIASGSGINVNTTWDATNVSTGTHTISLSATDKAGNNTTKTVTVRVDKTKPTLRFVYPSPGAVQRPGITMPVILDITDLNFNKDDATQSSVDISGVSIVIRDSANNKIAEVSTSKPLDPRNPNTNGDTTVARYTGSVVISLPNPFKSRQTYTLEATVTDKSGNVSDKAKTTFVVRFL